MWITSDHQWCRNSRNSQQHRAKNEAGLPRAVRARAQHLVPLLISPYLAAPNPPARNKNIKLAPCLITALALSLSTQHSAPNTASGMDLCSFSMGAPADTDDNRHSAENEWRFLLSV